MTKDLEQQSVASKQRTILLNPTPGVILRVPIVLPCPFSLTWMDPEDGPLSKCQLSSVSASVSTVIEAFTKTLGGTLRLTGIFLF